MIFIHENLTNTPEIQTQNEAEYEKIKTNISVEYISLPQVWPIKTVGILSVEDIVIVKHAIPTIYKEIKCDAV